MLIKLGDKAKCYILDHGSAEGEVFVIGLPLYSAGYDHIVCVAATIGQCMPVNVSHLTVISSDHDVSEMINALPKGFMKV